MPQNTITCTARSVACIICPAAGVQKTRLTPGYMSKQFESFERINSIRKNGNFDSCNSCKQLVPSRLYEIHESKFLHVSRIEFIIRNFRVFLLMYRIRTHSLGRARSGSAVLTVGGRRLNLARERLRWWDQRRSESPVFCRPPGTQSRTGPHP